MTHTLRYLILVLTAGSLLGLGIFFGSSSPNTSARAQGFGGAPSTEGLNIGVTTLMLKDGTQTSHAYAIDPRAGVVLFCQTSAQATKPSCTAVPIPGTAQR